MTIKTDIENEEYGQCVECDHDFNYGGQSDDDPDFCVNCIGGALSRGLGLSPCN